MILISQNNGVSPVRLFALVESLHLPKLTSFITKGNQVTPFSIETADGESLYAWHIMPLPTYLKNEDKLQAEPHGFVKDFTSTESFKVLRKDPNARLVIICKLFERVQ
jgi:hypothetical protein